jgi:two-component system, NtrC family, response regulator AtoC
LLAAHFVERFAREQNKRPPHLTSSAVAALSAHAWPGNVRELRNCLYRALALAPADALGPEHLGLSSAPVVAPVAVAPGASPAVASSGDAGERERILAALAQCAGNQSRAAVLLGISRRTLLRRLDQYQIARPRGADGDTDDDADGPAE